MNKNSVKIIARIAKQLNYTGKVTEDNAQEIVKSMAVNHPDFLAEKLAKGYDLAVKFYGFYESNETKHFEENYKLISDNLDGVFALLDIETDYPGLYPTFTIKRNGKTLSEYSTLGAIRQYNNFWSHW